MDDTLFQMEETPSPKKRWLKEKNVTVARNPKLNDDMDHWEAWVGEYGAAAQARMDDTETARFATGATEEEAMHNLVMKNGWKYWNEEEL